MILLMDVVDIASMTVYSICVCVKRSLFVCLIDFEWRHLGSGGQVRSICQAAPTKK